MLLLPLSRALAWPDCFVDSVYDFQPGAEASFGHEYLPDQVTGFPGESSPTAGSLKVVSLGRGGCITLEFVDNVIVDKPGPDFIVFENAFFSGAVPESPAEDYCVFAEPIIVEVKNGETWRRFPFDQGALDLAGDTSGSVRPFCGDTLLRLYGLAGITPTFKGDLIKPDLTFTWDPQGVGGVSGWGGDAFDLADLGIQSTRFVRLLDSGRALDFQGPSQGADVDTVIAIHCIPAPVQGTDSDGDGLDDLDETAAGTAPHHPDTDGDGMNDGDELASCLNPLAYGDTVSGIDTTLFMPEPGEALDQGGDDSGGDESAPWGCMVQDQGHGEGGASLLLVPLLLGFFLRTVLGKKRAARMPG